MPSNVVLAASNAFKVILQKIFLSRKKRISAAVGVQLGYPSPHESGHPLHCEQWEEFDGTEKSQGEELSSLSHCQR